MYFGLIVPAYGYAYFAPTIIKTFHYSNIQTQLHSVPPWAAAFGFAMLVAFASDKTRHRFAFTLIPICVSITGFALLLTNYGNRKVEYAALFLVTMGTYSAMPVIVCWFNMNLVSPSHLFPASFSFSSLSISTDPSNRADITAAAPAPPTKSPSVTSAASSPSTPSSPKPPLASSQATRSAFPLPASAPSAVVFILWGAWWRIGGGRGSRGMSG